MSIKGFWVKGQVQKYDYQELENLPLEKIFWAVYNTTTFTDIETASNAGKIVMLQLPAQLNNVIIPLSCFTTDGGTKHAEFYGVSGSGRGNSYVYIAYCDEGTNFWSMSRQLISELAPIQRVNNKNGNVILDASDVGALPASTVIPSKTSDLNNDSGFVNASGAVAAAPVQSVNGQTGNVTVPALPAGGITGQILAKASDTDYDTEWIDQSNGTEEVFCATYGETTADEICQAYADRKICHLRMNSLSPAEKAYYLTWCGTVVNLGPNGSVTEKKAIFSAIEGNSITTINVMGSTWSNENTIEYASKVSPSFSGTPKAPTATVGTNTTQIATTAFVQKAINEAVSSSGTFLVTVTGGDGTYTADKTYAQIAAAYQAGKIIEVVYGYGHFFLTFWSNDDSDPFMLFSRVHVDFTETIYIGSQGNVQWTQTYLQPHNMGAENAGKILVVGNNGNITMMTREQWESNY